MGTTGQVRDRCVHRGSRLSSEFQIRESGMITFNNTVNNTVYVTNINISKYK